ncbi:MAG: FliA/WhiG family RNA polymerase sigma factor [Terracidiphilus sp.]
MQTTMETISRPQRWIPGAGAFSLLSPAPNEDLAVVGSPVQCSPKLGQDVLELLPMVHRIAQRVHRRLPRHVEVDDLFSAGLLGLVEATVKFDTAKKVPFKSYAHFRVKGSILDSLRSSDWAPRLLRKKGRLVQQAIRALTVRSGYVPLEDEIAAELKISLNAYQKLRGDLKGLEVGGLPLTRDDDSGEDELVDLPGRTEDDPLFLCLRGEIEERLTAAIGALPERERLVMTLFYYKEMTWAEIGSVVGTGETRAQQIRTSAVLHLRSALSDFSVRSGRNFALTQRGCAETPKPIQWPRRPYLGPTQDDSKRVDDLCFGAESVESGYRRFVMTNNDFCTEKDS